MLQKRTPRAGGNRVPSVNEGEIAPSFELENDRGETVRLDGLRGKWVVLYWYPKDDTPAARRKRARSATAGR